ncbi:aminotransferase class III, partial [Burkholderia thailandensis]|nr:aminotransferase class III [Burkholderia thailandensis]NOK55609.1 aminotransferase class III [Burkholderia thailandensis]
MTYRNEGIAYVEPLHAQAHAHAHRTSAEYRALDAAHHIHPFSDMG